MEKCNANNKVDLVCKWYKKSEILKDLKVWKFWACRKQKNSEKTEKIGKKSLKRL